MLSDSCTYAIHSSFQTISEWFFQRIGKVLFPGKHDTGIGNGWNISLVRKKNESMITFYFWANKKKKQKQDNSNFNIRIQALDNSNTLINNLNYI